MPGFGRRGEDGQPALQGRTPGRHPLIGGFRRVGYESGATKASASTGPGAEAASRERRRVPNPGAPLNRGLREDPANHQQKRR